MKLAAWAWLVLPVVAVVSASCRGEGPASAATEQNPQCTIPKPDVVLTEADLRSPLPPDKLPRSASLIGEEPALVLVVPGPGREVEQAIRTLAEARTPLRKVVLGPPSAERTYRRAVGDDPNRVVWIVDRIGWPGEWAAAERPRAFLFGKPGQPIVPQPPDRPLEHFLRDAL